MPFRFTTIALSVWCFLTLALVYAHKWVYHWFGSLSLESMLTYLNLPRTGVESFYLMDLLVTLLPALPLTALLTIVLVLVRRFGSRWRVSLSSVVFLTVAGLLLVWVRLGYVVEDTHNVYDTLRFRGRTSSYYEEHYFDVDAASITFPAEKRNLLLLVVESLEDAVSDPGLFGTSLVPELDGIRQQHPHINRLISSEGTNYTMPAFTAFLYGVPQIYPAEDGKHYAFRPRTPSVLRILEDNGYKIVFLRGANALHNGMEALIERDTKNGTLYDLRFFLKNDPSLASSSNTWGLLDSYIFARARELLPHAAEEQPFAFVILTLNTHNPGFYEDSLPRIYGDARDSYVQTDVMASEFIEWALAQPWAEKTAIVVLGDHPPTMGRLGPITLPKERNSRTLFNVFINHGPALSLRQPERAASSWDIAPTILEALGAKVPGRRFGLGTSLFSQQQGLLEKVGLERHNSMVVRRSEKYRDLFYQPVDAGELSKWITHEPMVPEVAAQAIYGGGIIDGKINTNSLEAVLASIAEGHQFIGVDVVTTSDGWYVGGASWNLVNQFAGFPERGGEPQSLEEVLGYRFFGKYTPLTGEGIGRILREHESVHFIVDGADDFDRLAAQIPLPERIHVSVYTREDEERAIAAGLQAIFHKSTADFAMEPEWE